MTAADIFEDLEKKRARARRRLAVDLSVPFGLALVGILLFWNPMLDRATLGSVLFLGAVLFGVYGVLSVPQAFRRFNRHHQEEILPTVMGEMGMDVSCYPDSTPSWLVLHRARLFARAERVRPGPLLVGRADGVLIEAGSLVLTREAIIRKVRRIQELVFSGAVYMVDLGANAAPGDLVVLGRRAHWDRETRRETSWVSMPRSGMPFGTRIYARKGTSPVLSADALSALEKVLRLHPRALISVQDKRHLVVAVPGRAALFRAAAVFAPLARDARAARSVESMHLVANLGRAFGAPVEGSMSAPLVESDAPQSLVTLSKSADVSPAPQTSVAWREVWRGAQDMARTSAVFAKKGGKWAVSRSKKLLNKDESLSMEGASGFKVVNTQAARPAEHLVSSSEPAGDSRPV